MGAYVRELWGESLSAFEVTSPTPSAVFKEAGRQIKALGNPAVISASLSYDIDDEYMLRIVYNDEIVRASEVADFVPGAEEVGEDVPDDEILLVIAVGFLE